MRNIFLVDAHIVDANGTFSSIGGYPKLFDSRSYGDDVDKAKRRAEGDMSEAWGAMCKRDDRQVQVVTLSDVYGNLIDKKSMGDFPENHPQPEPEEDKTVPDEEPVQEPQEETEPEPEPEPEPNAE